MKKQEISDPGSELRSRFRALNAPLLGGDFADWCRNKRVDVGGYLEITWDAGRLGKGNTIVFKVTAIGERKILAKRVDRDYGETYLSADDSPLYSIRKMEA